MQNFEGFDDLLNNESFDGTDDMDPLSGAVSTASFQASTCSAGSSDASGRAWLSLVGAVCKQLFTLSTTSAAAINCEALIRVNPHCSRQLPSLQLERQAPRLLRLLSLPVHSDMETHRGALLTPCRLRPSSMPNIDAVRYAQSLPEREQMVLRMYIDGYTQAEIGAEVGLSTRQIRRIFKNMSALGRVVCISIDRDNHQNGPEC